MILYDGYCYNTAQDVIYKIESQKPDIASTYYVYLGNSTYTGNTITSTVYNKTVQTGLPAVTAGTLVRTYPTCATVGLHEPTLKQILDVPLAADLSQMWGLGFGLPVLCYLVAWGYGTVINWFNERR